MLYQKCQTIEEAFLHRRVIQPGKRPPEPLHLLGYSGNSSDWEKLLGFAETMSGQTWIDQLSIDQENNEERGQKVQLMSEISRTADHVVVWLSSPNHSDLALDEDDMQRAFGDQAQLNFLHQVQNRQDSGRHPIKITNRSRVSVADVILLKGLLLCSILTDRSRYHIHGCNEVPEAYMEQHVDDEPRKQDWRNLMRLTLRSANVAMSC